LILKQKSRQTVCNVKNLDTSEDIATKPGIQAHVRPSPSLCSIALGRTTGAPFVAKFVMGQRGMALSLSEVGAKDAAIMAPGQSRE
jgi:hypothetical protein